MECETSNTFTRGEKLVAASLLFTLLLISTLIIILIVAITETYRFNGAMEDMHEIATTINTKYGWLLGRDTTTEQAVGLGQNTSEPFIM